MARPWDRQNRSTRRDRPRPGRSEELADADADAEAEPPGRAVPLDGPEHSWWSARELTDVWAPRLAHHVPDPLAVHLGEDWEQAYGLDDLAAPANGGADPEATDGPSDGTGGTGAYAVLGIAPGASWDEIVEAHRAAARRHHPDRLAGEALDDSDRARAEESIIAINAAYQELRTRRGR